MWILDRQHIQPSEPSQQTLKILRNTMRIILCLMLAGWTLLPHPVDSSAQNDQTCPPGNASDLDRVQSVLEDTAYTSVRQELGISVSPHQARALTDEQDPSACETLANLFPKPDKKDRSFYKAGSYYFVMYQWDTDEGELISGPPGFIILDETFEPLRFFL